MEFIYHAAICSFVLFLCIFTMRLFGIFPEPSEIFFVAVSAILAQEIANLLVNHK